MSEPLKLEEIERKVNAAIKQALESREGATVVTLPDGTTINGVYYHILKFMNTLMEDPLVSRITVERNPDTGLWTEVAFVWQAVCSIGSSAE